MPDVYVSVGSNINPASNIQSAIAALRAAYGELIISPIYENEPVGFKGDNFYNLVIAFNTEDSVQIVARTLREIETAHGRTRQESKFSARTLDLDLLLFGDLVEQGDDYHVPRDEITRYAFVLTPLADIAPGILHPQLGQRIDSILKQVGSNWPKMQLINLSY